jgi:NAD+ kinase
MAKVGFILKPDKSQAGALLSELCQWLADRGHQALVTLEDKISSSAEVVTEEGFGAAVDLAVVLGGDGTMLRASRLIGNHGRPVLGINLGQLGFLTGFSAHDAIPALEAALAGRLEVAERMRIAVRYVRRGQSAVTHVALNDVVIHQGAMAKLVEIDAYLDGEMITSYRADGLIAATPTGSTAYSMAAGGPIVVPGQGAIVLTPICAHSLTNRPLVLPAQSTIRIQLGGDSREVVITVDGQWGHPFLPGDFVDITDAASPLRLFASGKSYFDIMRDKLNWGMRSDKVRG